MGQAAGERKNTFRFRHRLATGEVRDVEVHSGPIEVDGRAPPLLDHPRRHGARSAPQAELHRTISLLQSTLDSTDGRHPRHRPPAGASCPTTSASPRCGGSRRRCCESGDDEKAIDLRRRPAPRPRAVPARRSSRSTRSRTWRASTSWSSRTGASSSATRSRRRSTGSRWAACGASATSPDAAAPRPPSANPRPSFRLLFGRTTPMPMWVYDLRRPRASSRSTSRRWTTTATRATSSCPCTHQP